MRRELVEALEGNRDLTWDLWASPRDESQFLTAKGQHVAEWAVGQLQTFLGDDFIERVRVSGMAHPLLSPAIMTTLWPLIDSRCTYEDLFRLAAQLTLCLPGSKGRGRFQNIVRHNFDPTSWTHCLIQLELAGVGFTTRMDIRV